MALPEMNDIVVKSNLKEMKQNLGEKKRDELREGNSLGVPKSTVLVGKLEKKEREWLKEEKKKEQAQQKGFMNQEMLRLETLYR